MAGRNGNTVGNDIEVELVQRGHRPLMTIQKSLWILTMRHGLPIVFPCFQGARVQIVAVEFAVDTTVKSYHSANAQRADTSMTPRS